MVWPLAIWACGTARRVKRLCWAVVFGSLLVRLVVARYYGPALAEQLMPSRAGEMAFGGLFAMEVYGRSWLSKAGPKLLWVFALACSAMIVLRVDEKPLGTLVLHEAIALFAAALLASALNPQTIAARVLGTPFLAEVGRKYSYGLFVFHPMMMLATDHVLHLREGHTADGIVRVVVTVVTSVLLAKASYLYFERHFLHLKKLFPAERRPNMPAPVPRKIAEQPTMSPDLKAAS